MARGAGFVVVVAMVAAACGSDASTTTTTDEAATALTADPGPSAIKEWTVRDLGQPTVDSGAHMVEHDGKLWFVWQEDGADTLSVSTLDREVVRIAELDFAQQPLTMTMTSTAAGVVVTASGFEDFISHVWVTADGTNWSSSTITDEPFDAIGVVHVGGRFIASGSKRPSNDRGPFVPALFTSMDGIVWSETVIDDPTFGDEGTFGAPTIVDDRVLVFGQFGGAVPGNRWFESNDAGVTWRSVVEEGPIPSWLIAEGSALIGSRAFDSGSSEEHQLVINRGAGWEPIPIDRLTGPSIYNFAHPIGVDAPIFQLSTDRPIIYCYEDPDGCRTRKLTVVVDEAGVPSAIDPGAEDLDPGQALIGSDGALHLLVSQGYRVELRSWPAEQGPVPTLPPPMITEPSGPPLVEWESDLVVGETYRLPLFTHCGVDQLGRFNGLNWWLSENRDPGFGDSGLVLGEIHVVASNRIEYMVNGEVVAIYEPRPEELVDCM